MELFDTHAHFEGTSEETATVLERAFASGVTRLMAIGGSESLNRGAGLAAALAANPNVQTTPTPKPLPSVLKALGWDRDQAGKDLPELDYTGASAVGEIGLDYSYEGATRKDQLALFARQLELPVVIHTREADDDTLGVLREISSKGIIHCFTGTPKFCGKLLDLGFFISISGIVTFRAADNVRASARYVPDDRLLIETDSPFLAPVPKRGNPNEPAFVVHTAKFLADLRGTTPEALALLTTGNACRLLGC